MTGTLPSIVTEAPWDCSITVHHGEDWYDSFRLVDPSTGTIDPDTGMIDPDTCDPFNLTSVTLQLVVRPWLNHSTRFVLLTTVASAGIVKVDAADGKAAIFYSQANVEANLPLHTNTSGWEQFLRVLFTDPDFGAVKKLLWKGRMFVLPARDAATP